MASAAGFRDEQWEWSVEKFITISLETDKAIIDLVDELGIADSLFSDAAHVALVRKRRLSFQ